MNHRRGGHDVHFPPQDWLLPLKVVQNLLYLGMVWDDGVVASNTELQGRQTGLCPLFRARMTDKTGPLLLRMRNMTEGDRLRLQGRALNPAG